MSIKIGINGFGRIGRMVLRSIIENNRKDIEVVAINNRAKSEVSNFLLKHDTVHGKFEAKSNFSDQSLEINGKKIAMMHETEISKIDWKKHKVDIVLECTGIFASKEKSMKHVIAGAKKVIISAPAPEVDATIVQGVNDNILKKQHKIISNGSCTTNCLAPVAMILDKSIGIKSGYMTTIHSFTGDQSTLDTLHKDLRRARTASESLIPTSTGAAKALGLVLPKMKGKLDGTAIRVPTSNVSLIDLTFVSKKKTTIEDINNLIIRASKSKTLKGILTTNKLPLVSKDFNHNPASSIFDLTQTQVINENFCRVLSWYDNEWGFSNRMIDTALQLGKLI